MIRFTVTDNKYGRPAGAADGYRTKREARERFPSYSRYTVSEVSVPDDVEAVIERHAPTWWSAPEFSDILAALADLPDADRDAIAHHLWAMGGGYQHDGCIYADGDQDADYENECEPCRQRLLGVADEILQAVAS